MRRTAPLAFLLSALLALFLLPAAAHADTVFATGEGPDGGSAADAALEVGMKFRSSQNGYITKLRFFKQSDNTGAHVGHLWTASGQQLAEVPFTNETESGWQVAELPNAIAITANTTYVVSYHSPAGRFARTPWYFQTAPHGTGALTAPSGDNGVYKYGATSAFPDESWQSTNYWVDAEFATTPPPSAYR